MQQTHVIEQNDMSIDEYYSVFDRLMGSLTSMVPECSAAPCPAHKFIEKFFTYRFVMGVRAEYDSIRTRLLHSSSNLTMANALSDLLAEETHPKSLPLQCLMECWQLLGGLVHPIVPLLSLVSIVAGLIISQKIVSLIIQRS
jgi:hypothetical protein